MLKTQYTYDQEKFIITLGSGWNIPVDLIIGPHEGKFIQFKYKSRDGFF